MSTVLVLAGFPLLAAVLLLVLRADAARDAVVRVSALVIAALSIYLSIRYFQPASTFFQLDVGLISTVMMVIEIALALVIIVLSVKYKKYWATLLAAIQTPLLVWFELTRGHSIHVANSLYIDKLSIIMVLIIGIIGTLICVYSLPYMKEFQHHQAGGSDRRPWFFFLLFLFLAAMFGLVLSNNLMWLYFFWEITTLCSFFLIGYTGTKEATDNAFRALIMNLLGGLGFVLAIVALGTQHDTLELDQMISQGVAGADMVIPATLLTFAGITKAAQMPFQSWLLGAMVAPTPTSALLHSSTMVKAGVFLILKLSPLMGWNVQGLLAMMVGGTTFLIASAAAFSQSNAKRVLAYSTVANLGLIVACGGVGTAEAVWAGIMLVVFHAVTKSLLFLCVGTAEHQIGSRDIEDMDGLFNRYPRLAKYMIIGIAGMFLAPFGMLISKWAAMKAFVDSGNPVLVMTIVFGSAVTLFYWTKWLGKLVAIVAREQAADEKVPGEEWFVLGTQTVLVVLACFLFPLGSTTVVVPYLESTFSTVSGLALSSNNMLIMVGLLALVVLLPLLFSGRSRKRIVPIYLSGENTGNDLTYHGSMQKEVTLSLRNWYLEDYFGESKVNNIGVVATVLFIVVAFAALLGSVI